MLRIYLRDEPVSHGSSNTHYISFYLTCKLAKLCLSWMNKSNKRTCQTRYRKSQKCKISMRQKGSGTNCVVTKSNDSEATHSSAMLEIYIWEILTMFPTYSLTVHINLSGRSKAMLYSVSLRSTLFSAYSWSVSNTYTRARFRWNMFF